MENTTPYYIYPSVGGALSYGWKILKSKFLYLFLIVIILIVIDVPLGGAKENEESYIFPALKVIAEAILLAYWLLIVPVFNYSADMLFLKAVRKQEVDLKEIIIGFKYYMNIVLANLLTTALIGIALIALIIPGIIVACRLSFVSYLVMDQKLDPVSAVEKSWQMTSGYGWRIFLLGFVSFFIFIGGLILVIVGSFPALIWIKASWASLYQAVLEQSSGTSGEINGRPAVA